MLKPMPLAKLLEKEHALTKELEEFIILHLAAENVPAEDAVKLIRELEERAAKRVKK